jgi:hypothetical protein
MTFDDADIEVLRVSAWMTFDDVDVEVLRVPE